jgi:hypothetical protein
MDPRTDPAERPAEAPAAAPRPVVWPWLVVPAVTLAVFFVLRSCQQGAMRAAPAAPAATAEAPQAPAIGTPPAQ